MASRSMIESIDQPRGVPEPGSALPSLYVSPWSLLGRDLRAVLASLGLRARELWRRNGSAQLPLPPFWPRALARLFWPLVLLGLVLLPVGASTLWGRGGAQSVAVLPLPMPPPLEASSATEAEALKPPTNPSTKPSPEPVAPAEASEPAAAPIPPPLALDPLLELLTADAETGDRAALLSAARPQPERALLVLELAPGFLSLSAAERQQQADRWLMQATDLGYESLELVDEPGRVLGRQARVGTGMILLATG